MIKIVVQSEIAEQIRHSDGPIELVDDQGMRVGVVRRPPTDQEIALYTPMFQQLGNRAAAENVQWVLLNKVDFLFNY